MLSLATVFGLKHHEGTEVITFEHEKEAVVKAAHQSMKQLTEFDPPLAELQVPAVDARLEGIANDISMLATQFASADGVMILEMALLKILDIPEGSVAYAESSGDGYHSAHLVPGMRHLMGLHWINQKQIISLRGALDEMEEKF